MDPEENESQGHPAWQEILDQIPDSLHPLITPKLQEWDKRAQDMVQGVHSQYDPYKKFVENSVDPNILEQSLFMANALQNDPEAFVKRVIENYNLESFNQAQQAQEEDEDMGNTWDEGDDITQHPQFKALSEQLNTINSTLTAQQQREQEAQEQREYEAYMETLKESYKDKGGFDELYVSALMANGLDGDKAVEHYYETVGKAAAALTGQQQTQEVPVPVVMGGSGNAGSGTPDQQVKMGDLKNGEVMDLVTKMLEAQANNT